MNCGFDRELLSLYADGVLKRDLLLHVETHISECQECRRALEDMRELGKALNSLPREAAPHALVERILAEAKGTVRQTARDAVRQTVSAVWTVAMHGFRIEDEQEELVRRELPEWVVRWVLFV